VILLDLKPGIFDMPTEFATEKATKFINVKRSLMCCIDQALISWI
jgi:hypothetical protein